MGTLIWLIVTTAVGFLIGNFFFPDYVVMTSVIGFLFGLMNRFSKGSVVDILED